MSSQHEVPFEAVPAPLSSPSARESEDLPALSSEQEHDLIRTIADTYEDEQTRPIAMQALGRLVEANRPLMLRRAQYLVGVEAEEVVQRACLNVVRGLGNLQPRSDQAEKPGQRWLIAATSNAAIDMIRRRTVRERHLALGLEAVEDQLKYRQAHNPLDGMIDQVVDRSEIEAAFAQLPPQQAKVATLRYIGGLSTAEVATKLNISEGAVKSNSFKARESLLKHLTEARHVA